MREEDLRRSDPSERKMDKRLSWACCCLKDDRMRDEKLLDLNENLRFYQDAAKVVYLHLSSVLSDIGLCRLNFCPFSSKDCRKHQAYSQMGLENPSVDLSLALDSF